MGSTDFIIIIILQFFSRNIFFSKPVRRMTDADADANADCLAKHVEDKDSIPLLPFIAFN